MTTSRGSTRASINSTRACRARPRARRPPISPRSGPTSGWINWKVACSSSKRRRAESRAVSRLRAHPAIRAFLGALALAFTSFGVAAAAPVAAVDQLPQDQEVSRTVIDLAGWVVAAKDSQGYPFAVIDKAAAQILVFGGDGRLRGAAPGLFGSAVGDHSAPGVAGLALREIPGRDRTTPAGRFVGGFGPSIDAGRVLWGDYDSAVSIHQTATGATAARPAERLASPSQVDHRTTPYCSNVSSWYRPDTHLLVKSCVE